MKFYACLLFALLIISCKNDQESVYPVRSNITESVYASGIIKSRDQYEVFSKVNGILDLIYVSEGDTVSSSMPIMAISNEVSRLNTENARLAAELNDFKANQSKLNELKIKADFAKSRMSNDSLLFSRQLNLWQSGIGSKVELEQREIAFENSRTAYETSLINYNDVKRQLEITSRQAQKSWMISRSIEADYIIRSKMQGRVYALLKEQGELVTPQTPVAVIGSSDEFILELQVDEYDIVKIKHGQRALITLDSYKGELFEAVITKVNPLMNERSKTFKVEASFIKTPPQLYPNLTLEANIIIQTRENALLIPRNFILPGDSVIKADKKKIRIVIGLKDFDMAEVLEGLNENDEIIKIID